jgi:hypothetical protein
MDGYLLMICEADDHVPLGIFPTLEAALEWAATATGEEVYERFRRGVKASLGQFPADRPLGVIAFEGGLPADCAPLPGALSDRLHDLAQTANLRRVAANDQESARRRDRRPGGEDE